jgi:hypothetical protein
MKKLYSITFLLYVTIGIPGFSQTLKLEYDSMMNRYLAREFTQLEFKELSFAWRDLMDSIAYPEVPYDSLTKKVEYEFVNELEGISRDIIVNRVSEWAALTFGSMDGLLTHQGNASRLIINGSLELLFPDKGLVWKNSWRGYVEKELQNSSIAYFTMVFTIQDGKMKSRVMNIQYEYTDFVSERTVNRTLHSCFPISSNGKDEWKAIIGLVNETRSSLEIMNNLLLAYVEDYENDYNW